MTFPEKNNFVVRHTNADFFDQDRKLFEKLYPDSPLIPELRKANQYNKTHLDGRILLKILDAVCGETVLENRGIITDRMKEQTAKGPTSKEVAEPPAAGKEQEPVEEQQADTAKPNPRKKKAAPKKNIQA
ncbi:MAG: hypothetical protein PHD25_11995 [Bacteroidales bacterium]|nr:hypothetical protein [Bacteroidales bacterium]